VFESLKKQALHETMIMLAASVLPEFGHLIAEVPGKSIED
jgi:hypothetical protein